MSTGKLALGPLGASAAPFLQPGYPNSGFMQSQRRRGPCPQLTDHLRALWPEQSEAHHKNPGAWCKTFLSVRKSHVLERQTLSGPTLWPSSCLEASRQQVASAPRPSPLPSLWQVAPEMPSAPSRGSCPVNLPVGLDRDLFPSGVAGGVGCLF